MTLALEKPEYVHDLIAVDNAPVDVPIGSDFGMYVQAMKRVDQANVKTLTEADRILAEHIKASTSAMHPLPSLALLRLALSADT